MHHDRTLLDFEDACDWLTGYLLRKPETKAAILVPLLRQADRYVDQLVNLSVGTHIRSSDGQRILYPNGSIVRLYSMAQSGQLRGALFHVGLVQDWISAGASPGQFDTRRRALENLEMTVRLGDRPRLRFVHA